MVVVIVVDVVVASIAMVVWVVRERSPATAAIQMQVVAQRLEVWLMVIYPSKL